MRVMVVEDEAVVAVGIKSMIEEIGHEVVAVAKTGEEAVQVAADTRPDLALVDVKLPGMDGLETTRQLVGSTDAAVVILTAYADPEFVQGAASAGAFAYLMKPVSKEILAANIQLASARAAQLAELKKEANDIRTALEVRKLSERAKHVLMERLHLSEADAFAHLRQKCRNQNRTMRQVSEEILAADEAFLSVVDKEPPRRKHLAMPENENAARVGQTAEGG